MQPSAGNNSLKLSKYSQAVHPTQPQGIHHVMSAAQQQTMAAAQVAMQNPKKDESNRDLRERLQQTQYLLDQYVQAAQSQHQLLTNIKQLQATVAEVRQENIDIQEVHNAELGQLHRLLESQRTEQEE